MHSVIIIPARYGSKRFPGKPLTMLAGKTMLQRVCETASRAAEAIGHTRVLVATDDSRIADHAYEIGYEAVMTPETCESGTDRALAAIDALSQKPDVILNLQGDAPLTPPHFLVEVLRALQQPDVQVATPVTRLSWEALDQLRLHKQTTPFSGTTAVLAGNGDALWFSKQVLPAIRSEDILRQQPLSPVYRHIGLYGYKRTALEQFTRWPASLYEQLEGLEQLRFLENGVKIRAVVVEYGQYPAMSGVDTPEDAARAEVLLREYAWA